MRFCAWYPITEASVRVPAAPGVFQVRTAEVQAYPSGRSAMAHYGAGDDLRELVVAFARDVDPSWLCRHATDLGGRSPTEACERLLARFEARFGREPFASR